MTVFLLTLQWTSVSFILFYSEIRTMDHLSKKKWACFLTLNHNIAVIVIDISLQQSTYFLPSFGITRDNSFLEWSPKNCKSDCNKYIHVCSTIINWNYVYHFSLMNEQINEVHEQKYHEFNYNIYKWNLRSIVHLVVAFECVVQVWQQPPSSLVNRIHDNFLFLVAFSLSHRVSITRRLAWIRWNKSLGWKWLHDVGVHHLVMTKMIQVIAYVIRTT